MKKALTKKEIRVIERALGKLMGMDLSALVGTKVNVKTKRKAA